MELVNEIRGLFKTTNTGYARAITNLPNEYPAWVIKEAERVSVAVPMDTMAPFSETFSSVSLSARKLVKINQTNYDLLILSSDDMVTRNEFASFCADFVDPGENGFRRQELIADPSKWWKKWKGLVGNTSIDIKPYDVLAELLVIEKLMIEGKEPKWTGKTFGTNDIETKKTNYEVKSTISRYGNEITVSSLYQLAPKEGKELHLIFVKFEEADIGEESVEKVVKRLKRAGYNAAELETALKRHGLEIGRVGRTREYNVLEMRDYYVDETFPAVTPLSFKDEQMPSNIVKFSYTVSLNGLPFQAMD